MPRIAIMGGHGRVALELARILADAGHEVTSFIRKPEQREDVRRAGASPVVLDLERASVEDMAEAVSGHDALVWSAGAGGGDPARTYAVDRDAAIRSMDAARTANVRRYVMVSYLGAGPDHGVAEDHAFFPYAESKAAADAYLRESGLDWTILGPGRLTNEDAAGTIAPNPDSEMAGRDTSRADVARVAAAVLDEPRTIGTTIDFVDGDVPIAEAILRGS